MRDLSCTVKKYTVIVHTGDVSGAGTGANVFITIFGDKCDTGERKLHTSETYFNTFERNQIDRFIMEAADLGNLFKICIRHDNSNISPDWYLDYVEVIDTTNNQSYMFHCERWLGKNKDDGKIERTLYVKGYDGEMSSTGTLRSTARGSVLSLDSVKSSDPFSKSPRLTRKAMSMTMENIPEGPTIPYTLHISTGDGEDNGTDSNVWVRIIGPKKETGKMFLQLYQKDRFAPGSIETISIEAVDVNEIKKIEIGHDGITPGSGWYLKQVEVNMPTKGKHYTFPCKKWLARDKEDGKTSRFLHVDDGINSVTSFKPMIAYEMTVYTGDVQDAGTDTKITVTLFGAKGTASPVVLEKAGDRFERDRADLIKLELEDVAPVKKMRVETDGNGSRPDWFLDKIELRNMDTGALSVFECGEWFSKNKNDGKDGKLVRDLPCKVKGKLVIGKASYKISVKTSDVVGAGTDANVYIILFGANGDSGQLRLRKSETHEDPFEKNQIDVFTFHDMLSLGELAKCRVWHDNRGIGAAWHLNYIEVEDLGTKKTFHFPCFRWLSKSDDDGQILRELTCGSNIQSSSTNLHDENRLPPEILRMDKQSQQLYREALEAGKEKVFNIRLMIVGHLGVGKTTLTKCILGEKVAETPHVPTEGIEVHPRCCKIDLDTKEWIVESKEHCFPDNHQYLVNMISEHVAKKNKNLKYDVNQEEKKSTSGSIPVSFELNKEMSDDKNTLDEGKEENVHKKQNSVEIIYTRGINDTNSHSDLHEFVTKCGTMTHSGKTFCYVTLLDFAGEFVFYTTHQAFMSWRTLYLLVTDISKSLDELVGGDECSMNRNMKCHIQDYAIYWLNSIYSHGIPTGTSPQCEGSTQREIENDEQNLDGAAKFPPVIHVATHFDKVPEGEKDKRKNNYFDGMKRILKDRPQRFLLKGSFAISNFRQADIDALKQKLLELAEKQGYWGEEMPGRWLALEQKLIDLKRRGVKIIEYSLVEKMNTSSDVKIENPKELEVFLRFEHDLGNIVFFNTEKLRAKVVLDPEWLIDGLRNLTAPKPHMIDDHPEIHPEWYKFKDTGQLTEPLIDHLWSGDGHGDFLKNQEHLLDLMEKLSIIAKPVEKDSDVQDKKQYYWVPCVIYKSAPNHVKNPELREGMTRTSTLCFVSKTMFIHVGVFHRLVASFLSKWQPAKEDEEYHLYSCYCEFEVDDCHNLLLAMNDFVILATMFRYSSENEYPDYKLCSEVKKQISSLLDDITACISPYSKFDICVKCDRSSTDTINGLLPCSKKTQIRCSCTKPAHPVKVEDLLKFWEKKDDCPQQQEAVKSDFLSAEKQQDDKMHHDHPDPISKEHISHAGMGQGAVMPTQEGTCKNLRVQDKTQASPKDQAGNMKAEIDQTEAVFVHDQLVQSAKSVGIIRSPGTCGTGFRVGPCYIMTAKHVVDQILTGPPVPLQQKMQHHPYHQLSNNDVFIDFSYERDGLSSDENLRFCFEPKIVYANEYLDTVILKLKFDNKEYPPPLTNFHDIAQLPQERSHGYFIGHSRASIKKTDKYHFAKLTPDTITAAKEWSMKMVNVDGYVGIDDPHRVLLNCSFERGASGAPGLWICPRDGKAYVELMLLCGYPTWYYDDKYKGKTAGIPNSYLVEQGVSMKSVYDDMKNRDESLCKAIFPSGD